MAGDNQPEPSPAQSISTTSLVQRAPPMRRLRQLRALVALLYRHGRMRYPVALSRGLRANMRAAKAMAEGMVIASQMRTSCMEVIPFSAWRGSRTAVQAFSGQGTSFYSSDKTLRARSYFAASLCRVAGSSRAVRVGSVLSSRSACLTTRAMRLDRTRL